MSEEMDKIERLLKWLVIELQLQKLEKTLSLQIEVDEVRKKKGISLDGVDADFYISWMGNLKLQQPKITDIIDMRTEKIKEKKDG